MNHRFFASFLAMLLGILGCAVQAQDLEPRAFSNSPTGLTFAIAGYTYAKGSVLTDPALPIENVSVESHTAVFALATTLNVLGQTAKLDMIVPYMSLAGEGSVAEVRRERLVSDFGDPLFRFSMTFYGAPALTVDEFASYQQDLIVGASLRVGVPLGHYDEDKLMNIGSNRWSFRPEFGISKAFGRLTAEITPGLTLYSDNGDFFGGKTRKQEMLASVQANLSYTLAPGCWLAVNAAYFAGGGTTVDGVESNDEQEGLRLGATLSVPLNRHVSVKMFAFRGYNAYREADLDAMGLLLQYRWGGGF